MTTTAATFEKEGMEYVVMERVFERQDFRFYPKKFSLIFDFFYQKTVDVYSFSATVIDRLKSGIWVWYFLKKRCLSAV